MAIAFHDIPLNGCYIVGYTDWGYPVSGQRVSPFGERFITSVSFENYCYLAISLIRRIKRRSLLIVFIVKVTDSKDVKYNSIPQKCGKCCPTVGQLQLI